MIFAKKKDASPRLKLWRDVPEGGIAFALLGFRIEVHGYDADGSPVCSKGLDGSTFRDSQSG
jgi:hypothetical protein